MTAAITAQSTSATTGPACTTCLTWLSALEKNVEDGNFDAFEGERLQRLLVLAVKAYARKSEAEMRWLEPAPAGALTPTDVVVTVKALLDAVDLNIFDLAMWLRRVD